MNFKRSLLIYIFVGLAFSACRTVEPDAASRSGSNDISVSDANPTATPDRDKTLSTHSEEDTAAAKTAEPPEPPRTIVDLGSLHAGFILDGAGLSPMSRGSGDVEPYQIILRFDTPDRATMDILYSDERGYAEQDVSLRVISASCEGCYDFVGEGEWGAVRLHTAHLPVAGYAGPPIDAKLNFRGIIGMRLTDIRFVSK